MYKQANDIWFSLLILVDTLVLLVHNLLPVSLIYDFGKQNTRGNVSKISVGLVCYWQIGSKSTNCSHWCELLTFSTSYARLTEILETFPRVFCFPKSRINENGGNQINYFCNVSRLRGFPSELLDLPVQSTRCFLADVRPPDATDEAVMDDGCWPVGTMEALIQLVAGKKLVAKMLVSDGWYFIKV